MKLAVVAVYLSLLGICLAACPNPVANAVVPPGFCASIWAGGVNGPRGIITASNGDVLVVESGAGQVSLFYQDATGVHKTVIASAPNINHAILIHEGYLYASSTVAVYRWPYTAGTRTNLGAPQTVITNLPNGGHSTRSLAFTSLGMLLVQVGSGSNVDSNADRAGIRQFNIATVPQDYSTGTWLVTGLRNEVGLRYDVKGNLWGVENGMDDLNRADLGGDIHLGNPGEELNLFDVSVGRFYGYPYCWTQYNLSTVATPRGSQYGLSQFMNDGTHTDKWCQNTTNVVKPQYVLHPHTAPLDLYFYYGTSFPGYAGNLFVTQHGSWDSNPPVGYRVSLIHFTNGVPVADTPFFSYIGPGQTGNNWHRPVGLTIINYQGNDILLVTSDASGVIIAIQYSPSSINVVEDDN